MRNGQNKRMRGRNRKGGGGHHHQNPLSRMYESNGPDVKIRGTASHIAEKYLQLARDAQSSGDPIASENYYQHAEHYFRLIAAAQEQFRQSPALLPAATGDSAAINSDDGYDDGDDQPHIAASRLRRASRSPSIRASSSNRKQQHSISRSTANPQHGSNISPSTATTAQPAAPAARAAGERRKTSSGCRHSLPAASRSSSSRNRVKVRMALTAPMAERL
jgi:hypothetical protein